jgi:predicted ATP-binding protein involved in virulence
VSILTIHDLSLRNFRGFAERKFNFHKKLTLIVGENGSGKTSLLEALCVALGGWLCFFDGLDTADKRNLIKADRRVTIAKINAALLEQVPVIVQCKATLQIAQAISWERSIMSRGGRTTTSGLREIRMIAEEYNQKIHSGNDVDIILPVVVYYSAARLWNEPIRRTRTVNREKIRLEGYESAITYTTSIKDAMKYIDKIAYSAYRDDDSVAMAKMNAVLAAIKTTLETVVPDATVYYDMKLAQFCVRTNTDEIIPYSLLSDGYRSAVSLMIDICRRIMTLNPQLGENAIREVGGVVLIDEIDLHIHPKWQQNVLGDLQKIFPKVQFIVTTHAPSVIQSVNKESLMVLTKDDSYYYDGGVYGRDVNSIVEDIMGISPRPKEVALKFAEIYKQIDEGDLQAASEQTTALEKILGENDSELGGIRVTIDLESLEA